MSDELEVLHAIILTVEILCCVVEHMEVIHVLHGVYFLLQLAEVDIIVKAAASGASPRISRCLPLSLDGLDHFPGLGIDPSERVHAASLIGGMEDCVPAFAHDVLAARNAASASSPCRWPHQLLCCWNMVHLRLLMDRRGHVQARRRTTHHDLMVDLVLADVRRVLLPPGLLSFIEARLVLPFAVDFPSGGDHRRVLHPCLILRVDAASTRILR